MFKSANKPMGVTVALDPNDKAIAEGKKKYFGDRFVGKFLSREDVKMDEGIMICYMLHLFTDPNNEASFLQPPEGEFVSLRGTQMIVDAFDHGTDGSGIQPGDIVEVVIKGYKYGKSGLAKTNGYWEVAIGSFRPTQFKPAANAQTGNPQPPQQAVTQAPPASSQGVAQAKRLGY